MNFSMTITGNIYCFDQRTLKVIKVFQVNLSRNFSSETLRSLVGKPLQDILTIIIFVLKLFKTVTD